MAILAAAAEVCSEAGSAAQELLGLCCCSPSPARLLVLFDCVLLGQQQGSAMYMCVVVSQLVARVARFDGFIGLPVLAGRGCAVAAAVCRACCPQVPTHVLHWAVVGCLLGCSGPVSGLDWMAQPAAEGHQVYTHRGPTCAPSAGSQHLVCSCSLRALHASVDVLAQDAAVGV